VLIESSVFEVHEIMHEEPVKKIRSDVRVLNKNNYKGSVCIFWMGMAQGYRA